MGFKSNIIFTKAINAAAIKRISSASVTTSTSHQISILIRREAFLFLKLDIQTKSADFVAEHVEGHGCACFEGVCAFHHGLVNLGAAFDVVALYGQEFLQD